MEEDDSLREDGVVMIEGGGDDPFIEDRISEDVYQEDLPLGNGEAEEVDGDFVGWGVQNRGHDKMKGACLRNTLYPLPAGVFHTSIGLLPHVFPIRVVFCNSQAIRGFPCQETANQTLELEFKAYHSM